MAFSEGITTKNSQARFTLQKGVLHWSIRGSIYFEVLKPGQTVNADLYRKHFGLINQFLTINVPAIIKKKRQKEKSNLV